MARSIRVAVAAALTIALASAANGATSAPVPALKHVVVIVFENHERSAIVGNRDAPTFTLLAKRFAQATDYHAVAHPSLPNYLALVSGSTHGVTTDCTDCMQSGPTIGAQLTSRRRAWGTYAEGYPSNSNFAKKHEPFLYFPGEASHVFPLTAFRPEQLPSFAFVVPNLCHDMHDCSVATGDLWLRRFITPLLSMESTAVFVVFDEGTTDAGGGGMVSLIAAGRVVKPGSVFDPPADHYSLLRTIEDALRLPPLNGAAKARPLTGIWR